MNGLRYIRTRCNMSINELAEAIGVSRQAISSWENEKKEIPKQRLGQLEDFFGIDSTCFGSLDEEKKLYVTNKAMFRYDENGKQTYRFKPQDGITNLSMVDICFIPEKPYSVDEEYANAQKRKQETLAKIDEIIEWTKDAGSVESKISCINRGCNVYSMTSQLLEFVKEQKSIERIPLLNEMKSVWKAMMVAYEILDKESIELLDKSEYNYGEDGEWTLELAEQIKLHWEEKIISQREHLEKIKEQNKKMSDEDESCSFSDLSVKDAIAHAEYRYKERLKEDGDKPRDMTIFKFL